jgi:hypothetical protein
MVRAFQNAAQNSNSSATGNGRPENKLFENLNEATSVVPAGPLSVWQVPVMKTGPKRRSEQGIHNRFVTAEFINKYTQKLLWSASVALLSIFTGC